eukprot:15445665-Alexandrium_andersonii.AAC.1
MLRPLWRSRAVTLKHKVLVYRACVLSRLLYCTGALVLPQTAISSMEARHASYVRRLLAISATWGSIKMGEVPINNRKVLAAAGMPTLESMLREQQILALGHLFRSPEGSPQSMVLCDRFLRPRTLGGPRRRGLPRPR